MLVSLGMRGRKQDAEQQLAEQQLAEQQLAERIIALHRSGWTFKDIGEQLDREGFAPSTPAGWHPEVLRTVVEFEQDFASDDDSARGTGDPEV